jgi:hypothetical protein
MKKMPAEAGARQPLVAACGGGVGSLRSTMIATDPLLTNADVEGIFRDLGRKGIKLPKPSKVEVIPDEDYEGIPIYRLRVEFPEEIPAPDASWKIMNPFLSVAWRLVRERSNFERPVIEELVRLSDVGTPDDDEQEEDDG